MPLDRSIITNKKGIMMTPFLLLDFFSRKVNLLVGDGIGHYNAEYKQGQDNSKHDHKFQGFIASNIDW
jgi:hypothetical protein